MMRRQLVAAMAAVFAVAACDAPTTVPAAPAEPALSSSVLSASLGGPSQVKPNEYCTWFASGSGGTPPYTYKFQHLWSAAGEFTSDPTYTVAFGNGPQLVKVTVRDANLDTAEDQMAIHVTNGAPSC